MSVKIDRDANGNPTRVVVECGQRPVPKPFAVRNDRGELLPFDNLTDAKRCARTQASIRSEAVSVLAWNGRAYLPWCEEKPE